MYIPIFSPLHGDCVLDDCFMDKFDSVIDDLFLFCLRDFRNSFFSDSCCVDEGNVVGLHSMMLSEASFSSSPLVSLSLSFIRISLLREGCSLLKENNAFCLSNSRSIPRVNLLSPPLRSSRLPMFLNLSGLTQFDRQPIINL